MELFLSFESQEEYILVFSEIFSINVFNKRGHIILGMLASQRPTFSTIFTCFSVIPKLS